VNFIVDGTNNNRPAAYTNLGNATQQLATAAAAAQAGSAASLGSGLSLAAGRFGTSGVDFGFLLSAIASDSDNNILSTPTLVTMDNQEAEIVVGQNVPFVTGTQLSSANNNPFQTIERQDIGISLKVKPQINEGDNIKMEIEQEVSDVSSTSVTGASDITTNKRSIKTTVLVEDGQTLVLGGLIDDQISDTHDKVPMLGDIPLLGGLFRYRTTTKSKRNLMVFLHPTILRDVNTADYYSRSKYDDLRTAQLGLFDEDSLENRPSPKLPRLHLYYEGQRVKSSPHALDVPSANLQTTPDATSAVPAIEAIPAQAGANGALIGPFDSIDQ
jgi:general secretion pathway protein D